MLKARLLTAAVLIPLFLFLIFWANNLVLMGVKVFIWAMGLVFLIACWEWTRLSGFKTIWGRVLALAEIPVLTAALFAGLHALGLTGLYETESLRNTVVYSILAFWCLASVAVSVYPKGSKLYRSRFLNLLIGAFVLIPPWVTLIYLQSIKPSWLLYPLLLVWAADTSAYFVGKRFGRHPLAPAISPGKTWEGVLGAFLGALPVIIAGYFILLNRSVISLPIWILIGLITVLFSIVGDLFESLFKREQKLKDSGSILPGHGGVLDRIDSLTAALPIFAIGLIFF